MIKILTLLFIFVIGIVQFEGTIEMVEACDTSNLIALSYDNNVPCGEAGCSENTSRCQVCTHCKHVLIQSVGRFGINAPIVNLAYFKISESHTSNYLSELLRPPNA